MNILTSLPTPRHDTMTITIREVIENPDFLNEHEGKKVFYQIAAAFQSEKPVILSFQNLQKLTWPFIKGAIAKLYEIFPEEQIESQLNLVDITPESVEFIQQVIATKKQFIKNAAFVRKPFTDEELDKMRQQYPDHPLVQILGIFKDDEQFDEFLECMAEYRHQLDRESQNYDAQAG